MSSLISLFALALGASSAVSANPLVARQAFGTKNLSCDNNANNGTIFASQNGVPYQLLCHTDYLNGDLSNTHTDTLDDCIKACDTTKDCVTVVYDNSKNCYLKQQLVTRRDTDRTTTAKRVIIPELCNPDQLNNRFYFTASGLFQIYCRGDYLYGDLSSLATADLDDCVGNCSITAGCVGATWHDKQCFLKSKLVGGQRTDGASSAIRALSCGASDGLTYPTPDGNYFKIVCGRQYRGNDIRSVVTLSLENCIDACENESRCSNVAWTAGICRLKSAEGQLVTERPTWTAVRTSIAPN